LQARAIDPGWLFSQKKQEKERAEAEEESSHAPARHAQAERRASDALDFLFLAVAPPAVLTLFCCKWLEARVGPAMPVAGSCFILLAEWWTYRRHTSLYKVS
jgi:hypothetical protein